MVFIRIGSGLALGQSDIKEMYVNIDNIRDFCISENENSDHPQERFITTLNLMDGTSLIIDKNYAIGYAREAINTILQSAKNEIFRHNFTGF